MHMYIISNEHKLISTLNLSKKVNWSFLGKFINRYFIFWSRNQIESIVPIRFINNVGFLCKQLKLFVSALIKDFISPYTFTNISYSECRIKCFNEILAQSTIAYLIRLHDFIFYYFFLREKGSHYYNEIIDDKKITALR